MPLHLVDVVGVLAPVSLVVMLLGPAPSIVQVHKTRSTRTTPLAPLVAMAANGWIWTMYGYLEDNLFPVAISNFVGFLLGVGYTVVYYNHTLDHAYARKIISVFSLCIAIVTVYAVAGTHGLINQSRAQVVNGLGYAGVITVLLFFSSPFENIAQVFKYRSNAFIPILLVSAGAVNSAMWSIYSFLTSDWFIFAPNFSAFLIGCAQIVLYLYFQPQEGSYVELGTVGTSEKDLEAASAELLHRGLTDGHGAVSSPRILPLQSPLRTPPMGYGTSSQ